VQSKALPLALRGKDVVARARTGSGKTGAYALPIVQKLLLDEILDSSKTAVKRTGPRAVVLVPTRELVEQVGMPRQIVAPMATLDIIENYFDGCVV
jgi:ATP-dependent RNA helicase DDX56/DBP9